MATDQWTLDFQPNGPQFIPPAQSFTVFKVPEHLLESRAPDGDYFKVVMLYLGLQNRILKPDTPAKLKVHNLKLEVASKLHCKLQTCNPPSSWDAFAKLVVEDANIARSYFQEPVEMSDAGVQNHLALDALFIVFYFQYLNDRTFNIKGFTDLAKERAATIKSLGLQSDFLLVENQVPMYLLKHVVQELCRIDDVRATKPTNLNSFVEEELNVVLLMAVMNLLPLSKPTVVRPIPDPCAPTNLFAWNASSVGARFRRWIHGETKVPDNMLWEYFRLYYPPHLPHALENCRHILDCVYRVVCGHVQPPYEWDMKQLANPLLESIPSAAQLEDVGIKVENSTQCTGNSVELMHGSRIWLSSARLKLPKVEIYDFTAQHFRNLAIYEQLYTSQYNSALQCFEDHYNSDLRCFLVCMHDLCKEATDVQLLRKRGVMTLHVRDEDALSMWDRILKDLEGPTPSHAWLKCYNDVHKHCGSSWNRWRGRHCVMFFRQPWKVVSVVAAIVLLALTALQTWFTVVNSTSSKERWPSRN